MLKAEREGFQSIEEMVTLNKKIGHHFFDPDTLRFWQSRISPQIYAGRYFVTSESSFDRKTRFYTVREMLKDGRINTVSEFQQLKSRSAAHRFAQKLAEAIQ